MKANNKTHTLLIGGSAAAVLVLSLVIWALAPKENTVPSLVTATRGTVVESVSDDGTVKPADNVDLGFDTGGKIASVSAQVGDHVTRGSILATIDSSTLVAQRAEAQANLLTQQAVLANLKTGARPEDIAVVQAKVDSANTAVTSAQKTLRDALAAAYTSADDAIHNKTDVLFTTPNTDPTLIAITLPDSQQKTNVESERFGLGAVFAGWQTALADTSSATTLATATTKTTDALSSVQSYLADLATTFNGAVANTLYSQSSLDTYRSTISTARSAVNTAITSVTAASKGLDAATNALAVAQRELQSTVAGATKEDLDAQQAKVASAQAAVQALDAQIAKTVLRSPISGTVSRQDAKVGQIAVAGTPVVSVISDARFQIESYVPESDVAKIHVGDSASTTLDAYGAGVVFGAHVIKVDPAQTMQNGSPTYKVTLQFDQADDRIKPGMTANATILIAQKPGVLVVPARSVFTTNNASFVMKYQNGTFTPQTVTTGITGSDGMVEIVSGLSAGDQIESFGN